MKAIGKFILLHPDEFDDWLKDQKISRKVSLVQHHHTYVPAYRHFTGDNHFALCAGMEKSHKERGFAEIAQNFTTFPDGTIMVCRSMNTIPAGIKGANSRGVCIENVGNFDIGRDIMSNLQRDTIIKITRSLLQKFSLKKDETTIVYHHWYDLVLGRRISREGTGSTKSCPGTAFFGGNTINSFKTGLMPHI